MPSVLLAGTPHVGSAELLLLLPLLLGAVSIYLLLPRPEPYPALWGGLTGGVALVLGGVFLIHAGFPVFEDLHVAIENLLFYLFSAGALVSGVLLVTQSNPARAALSFTIVVLSTCGLFLILAAPFLMAATIIIYAGAIVVTFLFVLMLASQAGRSDADARSREPAFAVLTGVVLLAGIVYVLQMGTDAEPTRKGEEALAAIAQRVQAAQARTTSEELKKETEAPGREQDTLFVKAGEAFGDLQLAERKQSALELNKRWWSLRDQPSREPAQEAEKAKALHGVLGDLEALLESGRGELRQRAGLPYLHTDETIQPLAVTSGLSGTAAGVPPGQVRRDGQGRPMMPADNAAYLGKSLFTDYLVPVELGGLLLLVATVGAIAIAYRHQAPGRAL